MYDNYSNKKLILPTGYGGFTPRSEWGRIGEGMSRHWSWEAKRKILSNSTNWFTFRSELFSIFPLAALFYALFGIPIILLYLSIMGDGLSSIMKCIFKRLRAPSKSSSLISNSNSSSSSSSTPPLSSSTNNAEAANTKVITNLDSKNKQKYIQWSLNEGELMK